MTTETDTLRFPFGRNWLSFSRTFSAERLAAAKQSLRGFLGRDSLTGFSFLDVGCGSGLFSLAAHQLGAAVVSFDLDADSCLATQRLRDAQPESPAAWVLRQGSILDPAFLATLGRFDIVYAWGVLHHTGDLAQALHNAARCVRAGGVLYTAIYNYQPYLTRLNTLMKRTYNRTGPAGQAALLSAFSLFMVLKGGIRDLVCLRNPLQRYRCSVRERGMSLWHDWRDWVGGYPFEAARPEQIIDPLLADGFTLLRLTTVGGRHGCNQFLFHREPVSSASGVKPREATTP